MDTSPSNTTPFKERESRSSSPAATEERLSRLEGDVAEIKDSLATILRLVSSNKEINKEVESPNSKLESESASEDMLEPDSPNSKSESESVLEEMIITAEESVLEEMIITAEKSILFKCLNKYTGCTIPVGEIVKINILEVDVSLDHSVLTCTPVRLIYKGRRYKEPGKYAKIRGIIVN